MSKFEWNAEVRTELGKGASRRLRRDGKVLAIMYGAGKEPQTICLEQDSTYRALNDEKTYSHVLQINLGGKMERAVVKDVHRHPYKPIILHMDLQRVSETEALRIHVPVHFVGDAAAPGVKAGGLVHHLVVEVEVSCLPKDLPEFIEVDISHLNIGDTVHMSDIKLPAGVQLVELARGAGHDQPVVSITRQRAEEAEAAPAAAAAAPAPAKAAPAKAAPAKK
jgi:large subunit ribosomal protein L25